MNSNPRKTEKARTLFRAAAGLMAIGLIYFALVQGFPQLFGISDEPSLPMMFFFGFAGVSFGTIALTGYSMAERGQRNRSLQEAAMKYCNGEITLEEYGQQTKLILGD